MQAIDMYRKSLERRSQLGLGAIKDHIQSQNLTVEDFPHHKEVSVSEPVLCSASGRCASFCLSVHCPTPSLGASGAASALL